MQYNYSSEHHLKLLDYISMQEVKRKRTKRQKRLLRLRKRELLLRNKAFEGKEGANINIPPTKSENQQTKTESPFPQEIKQNE